MIYTIQRDPYLKRLPSVIDRVYEIQAYDVDNLYPQRADEVRNGSFTLKSAIDRITDFIKGQGWEDPNLANLIVNSEGMTGNDVLDFIAQDKSPYSGFAIHFKYNLNFRIAEITPIEWMYARLGLPDERGAVTNIKYSTNWERDPSKVLHHPYEIEEYHPFNPDPNVVRQQMEQCGGWQNYKGQILYWTPKPGKYPKVRFDAAFDYAQAQREIGVASVSGIQNKFSAQHIFKYPGKFADEKEERDFRQALSEFQGSEGTNSTMVIEDPSGEARQLVESIQMQNTDKMYEFTSKDARNALRETLAVPAPILGQLPDSGMFNQQEIKDSYDYMNIMTAGDRDQIARVFEKIIKHWKDPIPLASVKIKPLQSSETSEKTLIEIVGVGGSQAMISILTQFAEGKLTETQASNTLQILFGISPEDATRMVQKGVPTGTPGTPAAPGTQPPSEQTINDNLKNLTGKQMQNIQRIVRKFNKGELSYDQAKEMLKSGFAFTDAQVDLWVVTPDEEEA